MNPLLEHAARAIVTGVLATAVMDLWLLALRRLGIPALDFALVGRWIGHWGRGVFMHAAIAKASPVKHELALGWSFHYLTGMAFAALLLAITGPEWASNPTLPPALAVGIATVAAPWLVMQPAMGAGIASRRTLAPRMNRARSLANHTVFGFGLYAAAFLVAWISRQGLDMFGIPMKGTIQ